RYHKLLGEPAWRAMRNSYRNSLRYKLPLLGTLVSTDQAVSLDQRHAPYWPCLSTFCNRSPCDAWREPILHPWESRLETRTRLFLPNCCQCWSDSKSQHLGQTQDCLD